jgi:hypothetical protein
MIRIGIVTGNAHFSKYKKSFEFLTSKRIFHTKSKFFKDTRFRGKLRSPKRPNDLKTLIVYLIAWIDFQISFYKKCVQISKIELIYKSGRPAIKNFYLVWTSQSFYDSIIRFQTILYTKVDYSYLNEKARGKAIQWTKKKQKL